MPLSPLDLAEATHTVETLLARLELDAFLFAIEHNERGWELRVECAADDGWIADTIALGDELPDASDADAALRDRLLALLVERIRHCKKRR
ncbi:MAG: hypothetical protein ROZ37_05430 [Aromatoleum sp.]|uniref:hypothetical protein n=1 Tax=Aromatoleum sp. TaxID=2307007 RepID=UPI0028955DF7|nr:hypothetical protein [Aromatoleum sp.]MDT3669761.1 hypothetical protein [Aromatoleum sp.]